MERAERKSERDKDRESRRESVGESERDILSFKRCLSTPVIKSQPAGDHRSSLQS